MLRSGVSPALGSGIRRATSDRRGGLHSGVRLPEDSRTKWWHRSLREEHPHYRKMRVLTAALALSGAAGAFAASIASRGTGPMFSAFAVASAALAPAVSLPVGLIILGFAGRFDIPPFGVFPLDISMWALVGVSVACSRVGQRRKDVQGHLEPGDCFFRGILLLWW